MCQKQKFAFGVNVSFLVRFCIPSVPNFQLSIFGNAVHITGCTDDFVRFFVNHHKRQTFVGIVFFQRRVDVLFNRFFRRNRCKPKLRQIAVFAGFHQIVFIFDSEWAKQYIFSFEDYFIEPFFHF